MSQLDALYAAYQPKKIYNAAKRWMDLAAALLLLPLAAAPMLAIAAAVKLTSKGPVFYRGVRTGRFGKPFNIYKFRSMIADAENMGGGTTRLNDPRVTPVGRFLRRCKADELAQIFNILKGDMSFIGPRPELEIYTSRYTGMNTIILNVRPGLTDISSLKFISLEEVVGMEDADETYEKYILDEKNALRCEYVLKQSFSLDLKLFFATAGRTVQKAFSAFSCRGNALRPESGKGVIR